jgi:DNA polymerase III delta prime subunit
VDQQAAEKPQAAAKELGYAVFEVNSGSRWSGKDVLDMVGDMSRNHQVSNKSVMDSSIDNPFTRAKKASKAPVVAQEEEAQMRQRQSLILFEEVDILFEEDKSFWTTVISLMSKSKRPIVPTCNDESLLPWDDLSLHANLRFSVPPRDLLVDHLLLMAANEGHLLQRPAVDALVQTNGNDIRASIMSLQFHCRMAIGDRKGGLG